MINEGKDIEVPTCLEQVELCKELAKEYIEEKGELVGMRMYRGIASKFFNGLPNSRNLKIRLSNELNTYGDLETIINDYLKENIDIN